MYEADNDHNDPDGVPPPSVTMPILLLRTVMMTDTMMMMVMAAIMASLALPMQLMIVEMSGLIRPQHLFPPFWCTAA